MPGVFVTDFRNINQRGSVSQQGQGLGQLADDVDIDTITAASGAPSASSLSQSERTSIELEISELENSIHHLQRSNAEMKEYLIAGKDDSDHVLIDSIEENERLMQRKIQQVEMYRTLLQQVDGLDQKVIHSSKDAGDEMKRDDNKEEKNKHG